MREYSNWVLQLSTRYQSCYFKLMCKINQLLGKDRDNCSPVFMTKTKYIVTLFILVLGNLVPSKQESTLWGWLLATGLVSPGDIIWYIQTKSNIRLGLYWTLKGKPLLVGAAIIVHRPSAPLEVNPNYFCNRAFKSYKVLGFEPSTRWVRHKVCKAVIRIIIFYLGMCDMEVYWSSCYDR